MTHKRLPILLAAIFIALFAFQNCSPPGEAPSSVTEVKRSSGGGSGDPYEGQAPPTLYCEARANVHDVRFLSLLMNGAGKYKVTLAAAGEFHVLQRDLALEMNRNVPVNWPFGSGGAVVSTYNVNIPGLTVVTGTDENGQSFVLEFDCP